MGLGSGFNILKHIRVLDRQVAAMQARLMSYASLPLVEMPTKFMNPKGWVRNPYIIIVFLNKFVQTLRPIDIQYFFDCFLCRRTFNLDHSILFITENIRGQIGSS